MPSVRLTTQVLRGLRLSSGKTEAYFWDDRLPGFGVRLRATATGQAKPYLLVQYRNTSGTSRKVGIGYWGKPWTLDDAREYARTLLTDAAKGRDPADERRQRRAESTFGEAVEQYLQERSRGDKPLSSGTLRDYEGLYRVHLKARLGGRRVSEVTHAEVVQTRAAIVRAGRNGKAGTAPVRTPDKAVLLIKSVYKWLRDSGLKIDSPADAVRVAQSRHAAKAFSPPQVAALARAFADEPNATAADLFRTGLLTGMRRGNLSAMRWDELDLSAGLWHIPKTKNGSAHTAVLPAPLVDLLRDRQSNGKGPWVFPSDGAVGHIVSTFKPWRRCLLRARMYLLADRIVAAGITCKLDPTATTAAEVDRLAGIASEANVDTSGTEMDFRLHDLRAHFATMLSAGGQSTVVIAQMLGHRTLAMAQRYAQTQESTHRRASDQAAAAILADAGLSASADVLPFRRSASR